jgi:glyoxylase-like metal-dependent hydrolase (beta-lactamase superfamily II)
MAEFDCAVNFPELSNKLDQVLSMPLLPPDIAVFERGWLSSNNVLLRAAEGACLIDSGYCSHAPQTVALISTHLGSEPLRRLLNTHLHSDHCGGNAALQAHFPDLLTSIPPGQADAVAHWDPQALSYTPTGQSCPQFRFDSILSPGQVLHIGQREWQIHAAPGHDPHSVILFDCASGILISADALWQNGFGVVFPEIEGQSAFSAVADTLDLIESLDVRCVIPGHGSVFTNVPQALAFARRRLDYFVADPGRHALHAAKVLIKFKLLEVQRYALQDLASWVSQTSYFSLLHQSYFDKIAQDQWLAQLLQDLVRVGAARQEGELLFNA